MYSLSVRANAIFFFFGCCLAALAVFNIATTIFIKTQPKLYNFNYNSTSLYQNKYTGVQHSSGEIELDVDFEPCFDWNTNLIFSWITATYITNGKNTSVTIWDRIMKRDKPLTHVVKEKKIHLRYPLFDKFNSLANKDIYLELHWEHMPVFGPILKKSIPLGNYKVRKDKTKPTKREIEREVGYDDL
jgi:hypothetical protein